MLAAILAVAIFLLPVIVLGPMMDRLVNTVLDIPQMRAITRRAFLIDRNATLVDLPEPPPLRDVRRRLRA